MFSSTSRTNLREGVTLDEYVIAKYIRLSVEDAKTDSLSIENQNLLLDRHIADLDIPNATMLTFVDNGHTGTNYDRPAVQELLDLVQQGRINCIAVKDFSRFGRNMIETAYYIERVFPMLNVRFISLSDCYDSDKLENGSGGLDVAFKFLLHEQYSCDLSRKIKSSKYAKAVKGEFITANCVYGYKKVVDHLEIDEPAAEVVRLIFNLAKEGHNIHQIADRLYADKYQTPRAYKRKVMDTPLSFVWGKTVLQKLLSNEQYIGTYTACKTKRIEVGNKNMVKVNESEWIKIPEHHPPIISQDVCDAVQKRITAKSKSRANGRADTVYRYSDISSVLAGKVVCGGCGHKMQMMRTKNAVFYCYFTKTAPDAKCHRNRILVSELEIIVLDKIRAWASALLSGGSTLESTHGVPAKDEASDIKIEDAKRILYERYVLGEIGAEEYKAAKALCDAKHDSVRRGEKTGESGTPGIALRQFAADVLNGAELSREAVGSLIKKVIVSPNKVVEILWMPLARRTR
jgi:DNA invertase Pin-like site-specific DNA recombinase